MLNIDEFVAIESRTMDGDGRNIPAHDCITLLECIVRIRVSERRRDQIGHVLIFALDHFL